MKEVEKEKVVRHIIYSSAIILGFTLIGMGLGKIICKSLPITLIGLGIGFIIATFSIMKNEY